MSRAPIRIDVAQHKVWLHDQPVTLPRLQFRMLAYLAVRQGRVISRQQIMRDVWQTDYVDDTKTLSMHASWLRKRLGDDPDNPRYLTTVRGIGFRLEAGTVDLVEPPTGPDPSLTRVMLVKPGDVLVFGNVGDLGNPQQAHQTVTALRDQLGLAAVLLFRGDIDMTAIPAAIEASSHA